MSEQTPIEWCDHSFNTHWGCSKVSPGCDNCYAESLARRLLPTHTTLWQPNGERRLFGEEHWVGPLRWERRAAKTGRRERVFCASMADVFDNHEDLPAVREMLWDLIRKTPHLDWLILTKRIGNAKAMLPADWGAGYPNVQLGASIVNQAEADRDVIKLLMTPARIHFLSCEPLLGSIGLKELPIPPDALLPQYGTSHGFRFNALQRDDDRMFQPPAFLDWVIAGGESGHHAREMEWDWPRKLRAQCAEAGVAFFMKQLSQATRSWFKDFEAFPEDLQVRQYPGSV